MEIVLYTAMTAAEFEKFGPLCPKIAWMACHFSPYGTGLSNLPTSLPANSLLILNDRTPICGHDPELVAQQLSETVETFHCSGILLDFQRAGDDEIAAAVAKLPYPLALTPPYAEKHDGAVFLPAPPLHVSLKTHIAPWSGRTIWQEVALEHSCFRITSTGSNEVSREPLPCPHTDEQLHCAYGIDIRQNHVDFYLTRTLSQLPDFLAEGAALGISQFVGLYQQLGSFSSQATAQDTARFQL